MAFVIVTLVLAVLLLLFGLWYDRRHRGQLRDSAEMSAAADRSRDAAVQRDDERNRYPGSFGGSL